MIIVHSEEPLWSRKWGRGGVLAVTTPILLQQQKGSDFSGAAIAFSTTAAVYALFSWIRECINVALNNLPIRLAHGKQATYILRPNVRDE